MEGEKLMIGIARWANHLCEPKCDYYMSGGYNGRECVRLRALRPIVDGEELVTFYHSNCFGDNNADCLCRMDQLHGNQNVSSDETIKPTFRETAKKRCRKSKPRISLKPIVTPKLHLEEMIKFYEDCSNSSELSLEFEAPSDVQDEEKLDEIAAYVPPVDSGENQLVEDEIESDSFERLANFNEFVDRSGNFLSDTEITEISGLRFNEIFSSMRLREVNEVSAVNLIASLLAIVARHNCSDALLFDLIKRDQELFDHQKITPWLPLFISVADLPPKKRQRFQNIVLAALFVGSGYPDFNQMFQHMINELSSATFLKVGERKIELDFQPILFVADLIGKLKVLKMKQCNGFYGCNLCTQRGFHFAGSHRYPHDEKFVMRSHESHLMNLREL